MKPDYKQYNKISNGEPVENNVPVVKDLAPSEEEVKEEVVIKPIVEEKKEEMNKVGTIVKCVAVNLRSEPSTNSFIKKIINAKDTVIVLSKKNNFYFVRHGKEEGYIVEDYVALS